MSRGASGISPLPFGGGGVGGRSQPKLPESDVNEPYCEGAAHLTTVAAHNVNSNSVMAADVIPGVVMQLHTSASIFPPTLLNMDASRFPLNDGLQSHLLRLENDTFSRHFLEKVSFIPRQFLHLEKWRNSVSSLKR